MIQKLWVIKFVLEVECEIFELEDLLHIVLFFQKSLWFIENSPKGIGELCFRLWVAGPQ